MSCSRSCRDSLWILWRLRNPAFDEHHLGAVKQRFAPGAVFRDLRQQTPDEGNPVKSHGCQSADTPHIAATLLPQSLFELLKICLLAGITPTSASRQSGHHSGAFRPTLGNKLTLAGADIRHC